MSDDLYEKLERFFHSVFQTAPPALTPQYLFAEVKVWQQLDREYPGAVDLQKRDFDWGDNFNYSFWHSDPDAKSLYEWFDDARAGLIKDPRKRRDELYEQMAVDFWSVADINWKVSVLNHAMSYRFDTLANEKIMDIEDWIEYIRGKVTLSVGVSAKSKRSSFIYTDGEVFLLILNQDVFVFDSDSNFKNSMKYFIKDELLVATFAQPLLNWTHNFPTKLLRR